VQSLSDWFTPQNYAGETRAFPMSHRVTSGGGSDNRVFNLYGYSFALNNTKTLQSIQLPNNANVVVTAISVVPNWPPAFNVNPFTLSSVNAGANYSGTIATNASDYDGDALTFAKVSGPAWLNVAANGSLSGVPANSDANTNTFVVSVRDSGGLSNTATLYIYVNGAPSFTVNPFTMPDIVAGQNYSGTISTNATDPNPGDVLTFALLGGPSWLAVSTNGTLSGTPYSVNVGSNNFTVSVTDPGGLSNTAAMTIPVSPAPPIIATLAPQSGGLQLSWSGGIGPYDLQTASNLENAVWLDLGLISGTNFSITPTNSQSFYRLIGQ
jgi:Putative Ig domain